MTNFPTDTYIGPKRAFWHGFYSTDKISCYDIQSCLTLVSPIFNDLLII